MNLSTAIDRCKSGEMVSGGADGMRIASWLQELKTRRTLGAAAICDAEFPLLEENEIERDGFITRYVERAPSFEDSI